jgi:exonuclease I
MFLEFKFLSLAQAIEFYHRRRFEGYYLEPQKFNEIHSVLSETIRHYTDEKTHTTFNNKLGYLNQYTFKKRIREVLSHLNKKGLLKWNSNKRDSFSEIVGNYRDTLTHYENIDDSTLNFYELQNYVDEMKMVLAKCLLFEIFMRNRN